MGRKVFISFLGTNNYVNVLHQFEDGTLTTPSRFVQEAILDKVAAEWTENDKIFIFLTDDSRKTNWKNDGQRSIFEECERIGLEQILMSKPYWSICHPKPIEEGYNNDEIWNIFQTVYDLIEKDDEIYFDITHAFRSIPIFANTLLNYARFLKNTKVKSIYYGAFEKLGFANEVRKMLLEERIATVLDLTDIVGLQEWTSAAHLFIKTGQTELIANLIYDEETNSLKKFSSEIYEVRGLNIYSGINAVAVRDELVSIEQPYSPFDEIKKLLLSYFQNFTLDSIDNLYQAVKYCYEFNLVQQGLTIFNELIISKVLIEIGYKDINQLLDKTLRNVVSGALSINSKDRFDFELYKNEDDTIPERVTKLVGEVFNLVKRKKIYELFNSVAHGCRNDINHSGFRKEAKPIGYFREKLNEYIEKYEKVFSDVVITESIKISYFFLNLSNHPSSQWEPHQLEAADQFGELFNLPFPEINPEWDAAQIELLAGEYLQKIKKLAEEKSATPVVHLMGEYCFCFALGNLLKAEQIQTIVSTSERKSVMNDDGTKTIHFDFVQFRPYYT
jgi:CRISPR-associated Csx2 family protein